MGEAEHDADVLLSLSALIKAAELRIVFEGILLKRTLQLKVRVPRPPTLHVTYNGVSLPRSDNGTGRTERKGESSPSHYFRLIVSPPEECRSPGERPPIADVQEPHFAELVCLFPNESQWEKCQI